MKLYTLKNGDEQELKELIVVGLERLKLMVLSDEFNKRESMKKLVVVLCVLVQSASKQRGEREIGESFEALG